MDFDVIVIGSGVIGTAIARYLSLYELEAVVVEKEEDICSGTSKANSAIIHAGYDPQPGTLKAKLNVVGARMMEQESSRLGFDYRKNGAFVVSFSENTNIQLQVLYDRGIRNGVENMEIVSGDEARRIEPNLSENVTKALYLKDSGIVCPFSLVQALAENACENGTSFMFNSRVCAMEKKQGYFEVLLSSGKSLKARYVVNAAGVYSDEINNMLSRRKLHIIPKHGNYMLFDSRTKGLFNTTVFQLPTEKGKGVLVTPTFHGNLMIGPSCVESETKEDSSTYQDEFDSISEQAGLTCQSIPFRQVITSFSGTRAHEEGDDFVIGEAPDVQGFFNAAGIESPGLSCSLAIGKMVADMVASKAGAKAKVNPVLTRKPPVRASELSNQERSRLVKENPAYGRMVCRCEQISEGEIIDAITRPLGARSLDGIKRRVRAGMGRCQGGFCSPRVMQLLSQYAGIPINGICKNSEGSEMLTGGQHEV